MMKQNITEIIDGIKHSVETVGRSGRDSVYLDNVSFRIDAFSIQAPYGCSVQTARDFANSVLTRGTTWISDEVDHLEVFTFEDDSDLLSVQVLPPEQTSHGSRQDLVVTLMSCDIHADLPQIILDCGHLLHNFVLTNSTYPGRITFNIGYAYVKWDDVKRLFEWDDLEIPR